MLTESHQCLPIRSALLVSNVPLSTVIDTFSAGLLERFKAQQTKLFCQKNPAVLILMQDTYKRAYFGRVVKKAWVGRHNVSGTVQDKNLLIC